jgi:hypothetical protein
MSGEYEDMVKSGIIDPAKVTRSAVENAASIAAMILTTDVLITDVPEKNSSPSMPYRWWRVLISVEILKEEENGYFDEKRTGTINA